jgi:hypothetical protein
MAILALTLRFLLELAGVAALACWGLSVPVDGPLRAVPAAGAPLALILLWAIVVAPNATNRLPQARRQLIGTILLLATSVALATAGQPGAAIALGILVVIDALWLSALGDAADVTLQTMVGARR